MGIWNLESGIQSWAQSRKINSCPLDCSQITINIFRTSTHQGATQLEKVPFIALFLGEHVRGIDGARNVDGNNLLMVHRFLQSTLTDVELPHIARHCFVGVNLSDGTLVITIQEWGGCNYILCIQSLKEVS